MAENKQSVPPPPPTPDDSLEVVLNYGEYLLAKAKADRKDELAWSLWERFLRDWGPALLAMGRQVAQSMSFERAHQINDTVSCWAFKEATGEGNIGPVPDFDLKEALVATEMIETIPTPSVKGVVSKPLVCDPRLLAAMFTMGNFYLDPLNKQEIILNNGELALLLVRVPKRNGETER